MKILGIDPGLSNVGWGLVDLAGAKPATVACGSFSTSSKSPLSVRLKTIYDGIRAVVAEYQPEAAAVEEIFFAANVKTAVAMAHARGVAILALAENGVELFEYSPLQIKQSVVGYGRATKEQVQMMVSRLLGMKQDPLNEHAADALAAAMCHAASLKRRALVQQAIAQQQRISPGRQ